MAITNYRTVDPETSVQAGLQVDRNELWAMISSALKQHGPMTTSRLRILLVTVATVLALV